MLMQTRVVNGTQWPEGVGWWRELVVIEDNKKNDKMKGECEASEERKEGEEEKTENIKKTNMAKNKNKKKQELEDEEEEEER